MEVDFACCQKKIKESENESKNKCCSSKDLPLQCEQKCAQDNTNNKQIVECKSIPETHEQGHITSNKVIINGNINKNINGDINKNINGDINKNVNGDINKNVNGDINKNVNGENINCIDVINIYSNLKVDWAKILFMPGINQINKIKDFGRFEELTYIQKELIRLISVYRFSMLNSYKNQITYCLDVVMYNCGICRTLFYYDDKIITTLYNIARTIYIFLKNNNNIDAGEKKILDIVIYALTNLILPENFYVEVFDITIKNKLFYVTSLLISCMPEIYNNFYNKTVNKEKTSNGILCKLFESIVYCNEMQKIKCIENINKIIGMNYFDHANKIEQYIEQLLENKLYITSKVQLLDLKKQVSMYNSRSAAHRSSYNENNNDNDNNDENKNENKNVKKDYTPIKYIVNHGKEHYYSDRSYNGFNPPQRGRTNPPKDITHQKYEKESSDFDLYSDLDLDSDKDSTSKIKIEDEEIQFVEDEPKKKETSVNYVPIKEILEKNKMKEIKKVQKKELQRKELQRKELQRKELYSEREKLKMENERLKIEMDARYEKFINRNNEDIEMKNNKEFIEYCEKNSIFDQAVKKRLYQLFLMDH